MRTKMNRCSQLMPISSSGENSKDAGTPGHVKDLQNGHSRIDVAVRAVSLTYTGDVFGDTN